MTELQGHEDRVEIGADSGVFFRSRTEGLHDRSRVSGSAPSLCQRAGCYQSRPWVLQGPALRGNADPAGGLVVPALPAESIVKTRPVRPSVSIRVWTAGISFNFSSTTS